MTSPASSPSPDTSRPPVKIGNVTLAARPVSESLAMSIELRMRSVARRGSDSEGEASISVINDCLLQVLASEEDIGLAIDELGAGHITGEELVHALLGTDEPNNRGERRAAEKVAARPPAATRNPNSRARRRGGKGGGR